MEEVQVMTKETAVAIRSDKTLTAIVGEIALLEQTIPNVKVTNDFEETAASEFRARAKACVKDMETMRKMQKAPYRKVAETIDKLYRPLKQSCESLVKLLDKQIAPYKASKVAVAELAQKRAMEAALEAKEVDDSVSTPAEVKAQTMTKTDSGSTYLRKVKKVEVVDPIKLYKAAMDNRNQIPLDVIQINEAKLKQVARGDTYKPKQWAKYGVRVWEEDEVATRT